MEKYIIDERTGWKYELVGDYYLPVGTHWISYSILALCNLSFIHLPHRESPKQASIIVIIGGRNIFSPRNDFQIICNTHLLL